MTQVAARPDATPVASPAQSTLATRGGPPVRTVRLNTFQLLMRRWERLGAYNAGQVMQISGPADLDRWRHAAAAVIGELGLGRPTFTDQGFTVTFRGPEAVPVDTQEAEFQTFVNVELNRPFTDEELPIRFTVLPLADGSHYFVAIYDHWIADSRAMRELMHRIFERYRSPDAESALPPLTLEAPAFNRLYRHHIGYLPRSMSLRESLKNISRHRHAFRVNLKNPLDFASHMIYSPMPRGLIDRVHRYAKGRGASVNDVFLGALGQSMGAYTEKDRYRRKKKAFHFARDRVGLGTIVDIREAARQPLDQVFGLYLSSYTVVLDRPEATPMDQLTRTIAARTHQIKENQGAVKGYTALMTARLWWDLARKPRLQAMMFHKNIPMAAGISNVNMSRSWVDMPETAEGPRVLDYLRISPAGPLSPLVFTLTTIRDRLSLCCTYRTTAFEAEQARMLVADFTRRLSETAP